MTSRPTSFGLSRLAPGLFVLLWSTGFIGAKFGLPYAEPLTFLLWRFALVTALMAAVALAVRAPWPTSPREVGHIAVGGLLVHAGYLGGVFSAIENGVPAGVVALIAALQPLLTAVAAGPVLGERVSPRQWAGLGLGLAGVTLVVAEKIEPGAAFGAGLGFAFFAVLSITAGTLYQKRHAAGMDLRSGAVIQYAAAGAAMALLAPAVESMAVDWTGEFIFALGWLTLVLSVGAISLLYRLIRVGSAARVASLFYLVPPSTAVIAYLLFGETFGLLALAGMAVTVAGVALATRG